MVFSSLLLDCILSFKFLVSFMKMNVKSESNITPRILGLLLVGIGVLCSSIARGVFISDSDSSRCRYLRKSLTV